MLAFKCSFFLLSSSFSFPRCVKNNDTNEISWGKRESECMENVDKLGRAAARQAGREATTNERRADTPYAECEKGFRSAYVPYHTLDKRVCLW